MHRMPALTFAFVLALYVAARADVGTPRARPIGLGARALALANNYSALSNDFSALYHNPAGLGFVKAREAHIALNGLIALGTSELGGATSDASNERLRLSSGGMV